MYRQILSIFLLLLLVSCTTHPIPETQQHYKEKLYAFLVHMDQDIEPSEARILARESIRHSKRLALQYKVSTPPLVHNFLTNIGVKGRGLCYQWSDDLYSHLQQYHFKSIQLLPVGAHVGSYWREHNAIVALPVHSNDLNQGILLDAWRASGKLYFVPITQDPDYHWQIRTDRRDVYRSGYGYFLKKEK